jgi:hypothetical protein
MRSHRSFVAIMVASLITLASPQVLAKTFGKTVKVENCQIVEISKGFMNPPKRLVRRLET